MGAVEEGCGGVGSVSESVVGREMSRTERPLEADCRQVARNHFRRLITANLTISDGMLAIVDQGRDTKRSERHTEAALPLPFDPCSPVF